MFTTFVAYWQDTFGFQFEYRPLGFSRHAQTCSAQTLNVVFHWNGCPPEALKKLGV